MSREAGVIDISSRGWGRFKDKRFRVQLGRLGISADKREGDGKTPSGLFALRRGFFREDRLACPKTHLPFRALTQQDGWCDDPQDIFYNHLVGLPYRGHTERLWRADNLYDIILVIGFNDSPPEPYLGSAIFVHLVSQDKRATDGCVALEFRDMLRILEYSDEGTRIHIRVD